MADEAPPRGALHDSLADDVIAAQVHAMLFDAAPAPTKIGRFTIVRSLGAGAMGTVWLGRDDELDRDVAIKVLRAGHRDDPDLAARMLAEARGLAKLAHPNVVVVHEVGTTERGVFIAMEYVDGGTLAQWQAEPGRTVVELAEMYAQAGRGLAAAHSVGLVHRDFKPDNVLVGRDGRARVVDFGLARLVGAKETTGGDADDDFRRTRVGALVGTPAYMAPEQLDGREADARSDQFSFGLALFEAIAGRPAFGGDTIATRRAAMSREAIAWPPTITRAVRRAIERMLAIDPPARWPDMQSAIAALHVGSRRRWIVPVGVVAVGAAIFAGRSIGATDPCADAGQREGEVWNEARRSAAASRWDGVPFGAASWATTTAGLDAATARLVDAAKSACAAGRLREDAELTAASTACLEVMTAEIDALARDLDAPTRETIAAAPHRATTLPDAGACADPRRAKLVAVDAEAMAPARAAIGRARAAHAELVFGRSTGFATRLDAALVDARSAAQSAEQAQGRIVAALARTLEARLLLRRGDTTSAEQAAAKAVEHATIVDDPVLRAAAMIQLVYAIGSVGDRGEEARTLAEQASALVAAAGDPPLLRAQLENNLGLVIARATDADPDASIAHHRAALDAFERALGAAHPDTLAARVNLGSALAKLERPDDALAELEPTVAPALEVWGEEHPSTARLFGVIGNAWMRKNELAVAETWLRRALASSIAVAPGDAEVANAQYNLAQVLRRQMGAIDAAPTPAQATAGREAATLLRSALAIRERLEGRESANLIPYLVALGESELGAADYAAAESVLRRGLELCERSGAPALDFARVRLALGRALEQREPTEARVLLQSARAAFATAGRTTSVQTCERILERLTR
jgi:tetratricopeptide (TPR) repeat protein